MKATTFLERQLLHNTELVVLLEVEHHLRAPMTQQLARDLDTMLSLEEELFVPLAAPFATARERVNVRVTADGVHAALLDVVTANGDASFTEALASLRANLSQHVSAMRRLLDLADERLEPVRLQELGAAMARFESDALAAAPELARTAPATATTLVVGRAIVA